MEALHSLPKLTVLAQNSLSEEKYTRNGKPHPVHVVVKNSPFVVSLGTSNGNLAFSSYGSIPAVPQAMEPYLKYATNCELDLGKITFDCRLIYDNADPNVDEREVDYIQNKPFLFQVNTRNGGKQADITVRLKVLSSQHEDMFFVVKFIALDPITKREIVPPLVAHSYPIKVISKPEQLKKRRPSKKRTLNDMLLETLNRIEKTQKKQQKIVDRLASSSGSVGSSPSSGPSGSPMIRKGSVSGSGTSSEGDAFNNYSSASSSSSEASSPAGQNSADEHSHFPDLQRLLGDQSSSGPRQPEQADHAPPEAVPEVAHVDFEYAVEDILRKFQKLEPHDREAKLQKFMSTAFAISRRNDLVEMFDLFISEGMQQPVGREVPGNSGSLTADALREMGVSECNCGTCPHKQELEKIEMFYKDVFHL